MSRYKQFGEYMKKKLGVDLELFLAAEYAGVIQAIGAKQIEVMDMGAAGYAAAWLETKGGVEPLVVPTNNDGTIGYYAVAFVRADSPYKTLNDLKGKTWAWVEPNSSSGYIFPLVGFRRMGLEPEKHFGKVVFSGGHEQSIIGVLDKAYDGAITWTNDVEKHTRGGLHMMLTRGVLKKEDIRIIWDSDLIPNPVIAIRSDLPPQMKADLKAIFLNLHKDDPKVFREVARGESQGYARCSTRSTRSRSTCASRSAQERRRRSSRAGCRRTTVIRAAHASQASSLTVERFEEAYARLRRRQRVQLFGFAVLFLIVFHVAGERQQLQARAPARRIAADRRVPRHDGAGAQARHAGPTSAIGTTASCAGCSCLAIRCSSRSWRRCSARWGVSSCASRLRAISLVTSGSISCSAVSQRSRAASPRSSTRLFSSWRSAWGHSPDFSRSRRIRPARWRSYSRKPTRTSTSGSSKGSGRRAVTGSR